MNTRWNLDNRNISFSWSVGYIDHSFGTKISHYQVKPIILICLLHNFLCKFHGILLALQPWKLIGSNNHPRPSRINQLQQRKYRARKNQLKHQKQNRKQDWALLHDLIWMIHFKSIVFPQTPNFPFQLAIISALPACSTNHNSIKIAWYY